MATDIAEPHWRSAAGVVSCEDHATGLEVERLSARDKWVLMRESGSVVLCEVCRQEGLTD